MYLQLGRILKQVGLKGELKVSLTTNLYDRRFKKGNKIFILIENEYKELEIFSYRKFKKDFCVLSFLNYNTLELTEDFLGKIIFVEKNNNDLKDNEFFYVDLIGCKIFNNESEVGKVVSVEEFPAQLALKVKTDFAREFYLPFIPQFIKKVDIKNKKIDANLIEGML